MRIKTASLIVFLSATAASAQQSMPPGMSHEEHLKQLQREEALKRRGAAAMGFDQDTTIHHFLLAHDGGAIVVSSRTATDLTTIGQVRAHLREIAAAFANGDFDKPFATHGEVPPGVKVMAESKKKIQFAYVEAADGGRVTITTRDQAALAAIHDFLRYQITEHHTGDPLTIGQ